MEAGGRHSEGGNWGEALSGGFQDFDRVGVWVPSPPQASELIIIPVSRHLSALLTTASLQGAGKLSFVGTQS